MTMNSENIKVPWWRHDITTNNQDAIIESFENMQITCGAVSKRVEHMLSEKLGVKHVALTNSGSSALLVALLALDLPKGSEIIVPSVTWIATAQAVVLAGHKPVLIDCNADHPNLKLEGLEKKITNKTKAIIPVHLNGRDAGIGVIKTIAEKYNIYVVEDSCKALMSISNGSYLGSESNVGCFSLGLISTISVGYGGFCVTNNEDLYEKIISIRNHGVTRNPEEYKYLGFNFKISDLLASIAIKQINAIDEKIRCFVNLHDLYENEVKNDRVKILHVNKKSGGVPIYVEARVDDRGHFLGFLDEYGIHYSAYHRQVADANYLNSQDFFPNAESLCNRTVILPSGPAQSSNDIKYVIEVLNKY
jgi:perosamine synthetase